MTDHLWNQTLPEQEQRLAAYYSKGVVRDHELAEAHHMAQAALHAHAWDTGAATPDLNLLADYVISDGAAFTLGYVEDRLLAQIDQAIAQHEAPALSPEARALHGLGEPAPLPANLARMSADDLRSYRERLPDIWLTAVDAAYHRAEARADGPRGAGHAHLAIVRPDIHPIAALGLGISPDRQLTSDQINGLLSGHSAEGERIEGKRYIKERRLPADPKTGGERWSTPIGSYDFCPTPDKSVSVAWAFASDNEQAQIYGAHMEAAREAVAYIAERVGQARLGDGGKDGAEPGHVGWLEFTHHTARRTAIAVEGGKVTVSQDGGTAGDPDLHTHFLIPNAVFCDSGRVGSLDTAAIGGFIFEADAYYHARLAEKLREGGFAVDLDPRTGAARMPVIPAEVCDLFSKRTKAGELLVRKFTTDRGEDWDALTPGERETRMKAATQDREQKIAGGKDDVANFPDWQRQANDIGWMPPRSLQLVGPVQELGDEQRLRRAYETALPHLAEALERQSVLQHYAVRVAAFRGLVEWGCGARSDADAVTALMRAEGVTQYGERTALNWGQEAGKRSVSVTTELHEAQETEFIALAKGAAADRSGAIPAQLLAKRIDASRLDLSDEHGQAQRRAIERLGTGGRLGMMIAAAGAGKSTALRPIVSALKEQGREAWGISLAWQQADDLVKAGIDGRRVKAFSVMIDGLKDGSIKPGPGAVVAVDEWGLIGTRQGLELLRLQAKHEFSVVLLGDPKQCAAIEAGDVIALSRRALGADQVPEILTTKRQQTEREQKIVGLLRDGRAAEALDMKRSDGTAELVPGGYQGVIARTAALYAERLRVTGKAPLISAPTNQDAHQISEAVRLERRKLGLVGSDLRRVRAIDKDGRQYGMALATGDRVRLFKSTKAMERGGSIGRNGSVLEVVDMTDKGITLKTAAGRIGAVAWGTLTDKQTGRLLLAYGDATTIHTAQGSTASEQAERIAVKESRPLNDVHVITDNDKWSNVARALAYQPERDTATGLRERLGGLRQGAVRAFQATVPPPTKAHGAAVEHAHERTLRRLADRAIEHVRDLTHDLRQRLVPHRQPTWQQERDHGWEMER